MFDLKPTDFELTIDQEWELALAKITIAKADRDKLEELFLDVFKQLKIKENLLKATLSNKL